MAFTKPINIYMSVGVYYISNNLSREKMVMQMKQYQLRFPNMFSNKIKYSYIKKFKQRSCCLTFSHFFHTSIFLMFYIFPCYVKLKSISRWLAPSLKKSFISFLRTVLCSAWKKIQAPIIVFNKKADVKTSIICNSKSPPWNILKF